VAAQVLTSSDNESDIHREMGREVPEVEDNRPEECTDELDMSFRIRSQR
jgi:hypothetical protein